MSASVKIILHSKKYSDGTHAVMLQCIVSTDAGKHWKRRTICKVKPQQFDKVTCRVIKHPNLLILNAAIIDAFNKAEVKLNTAKLEGRKLDPAQIIDTETITVNRAAFLLAHSRVYAERCRQKGQFHTYEKCKSHCARLAEYLSTDKNGNQIDIHLDDVTEDWLLLWSEWLRQHGSKSENTLHGRMAYITTLYRDARKRGLTKSDPMAFLEFKQKKVRKPKLTVEQLDLLQTIVLAGRANDARNTFLLQFFAYGSRISDALNWKKTDIRVESGVWYLSYTSLKTGDLIDVRLNERAKELVSHYMETVPGAFLLPWLAKFEAIPGKSHQENKEHLYRQIESKNEIVNVQLRKIAKKAGIPINLTSHIARHTFAALADSRVSDKRKISAALGHSKFSTTEVYLEELRQTDVNDAMEMVWG